MDRRAFTEELRRLTELRSRSVSGGTNARVGGYLLARNRVPGWMTYVIQRGDAGPVKIGRTHDIRTRMASLGTASAEPLALLLLLSGDMEADLHRRFRAHRLEGEWFRPAAEIMTFVRG